MGPRDLGGIYRFKVLALAFGGVRALGLRALGLMFKALNAKSHGVSGLGFRVARIKCLINA